MLAHPGGVEGDVTVLWPVLREWRHDRSDMLPPGGAHMRTQRAAIAGPVVLAQVISTAGIGSAQTEADESAEPVQAPAVATESS